MTKEKKISFDVDIDKIKIETRQLFNDLSKEAQSQARDRKEQLKIIQEQIRALKDQNRLEREQSMIVLERRRAAGDLSYSQYKSQLSSIREDSGINRIQITLLEQMLHELKAQRVDDDEKEQTQQKTPSIGAQVFKGVVAAELLKELGRGISQMSGARNEFDLITSLPWAGPFLAPVRRSWELREQLYGAQARIRGRGGSPSGVGLTMLGLDAIETAHMEEGIINALGGRTSGAQVRNVAAISKAFSIDPGEINKYLSTGRMGADTNEQQLVGLLAEGVDRSRLTDAIQSAVSLMQLQGQSTLSPDRIDILQKIAEFNRIGGPFSVGDPRAVGLIGGFQQNIANPNDPFSQSLAYSTLRRMDPNASMLDLMIKRQSGGVLYMRNLMEDIAGMGGSEDFQVMQFARVAGMTGNLAAARHLFTNRGRLAAGGDQVNRLSQVELDDLMKEAISMTPSLERSTAEVTNAFIDSAGKGLLKLGELFSERMIEALSKIFTFADEKSEELARNTPTTYTVPITPGGDNLFHLYMKSRKNGDK